MTNTDDFPIARRLAFQKALARNRRKDRAITSSIRLVIAIIAIGAVYALAQ